MPTAHYPTTINSLERNNYEIRADAADFLFGCLLVVYVGYLIVFLLPHFAIVSSLLYVYFNFNTIYIERERERKRDIIYQYWNLEEIIQNENKIVKLDHCEQINS